MARGAQEAGSGPLQPVAKDTPYGKSNSTYSFYYQSFMNKASNIQFCVGDHCTSLLCLRPTFKLVSNQRAKACFSLRGMNLKRVFASETV